METSRVFAETMAAWLNPAVRIIVNRGGTRSGKTYSILQLFACIAEMRKSPLLFSVVTQTFPQLRAGAMRDFGKILTEFDFKENKTVHSYEIGASLVEFFSADQYTKVLGAQRDVLFVNECNRLAYEVVRQLMVRTSMKVFLDYNPVSDFWVNSEILARPDAVVIDSTYKDNPHLSAAQVAEIEAHRHDENWWRVYGLGLEGRLEGLVFPEWDLVDAMPEGCRLGYGIDFGYNDPSVLIKIGVRGEELYVQCLVYARNIITDDFEFLLEESGLHRRRERLIGDSAAKEQIETLYRRGWNVHPCVKGAGSILGGISRVKRYRMHIVREGCEPLQAELLNYTWEKDKNDRNLDVPIDAFNHCLDPLRYALTDLESRSGGYSLAFT